ncbi:MAG TPA: DUF4292 domain-containing protein [Bacteroidales bacterium]|nr:DUF4292 domain-containing protein [Bacteroidales bacterium]
MQSKVTVGVFIFLTMLMASCSSARKGKSISVSNNSNATEYKILDLSVKNNLLEKGFILKNAKLNISSKNYSGNMSLVARVNKDGDFMAIGKGPVGIEVFRVYGVNDSIWVIDRINRRIYEGRSNSVYEKYGLPSDFWRLIIGDIPESTALNTETVSKSKNEIDAFSNDDVYDRDLIIDRSVLKVKELNIYSHELGEDITFEYSNFKREDGNIYPGTVIVDSKSPMFHVEMNIENISCEVQDSIKKKLPDYRSFGL